MSPKMRFLVLLQPIGRGVSPGGLVFGQQLGGALPRGVMC